jgi:ankyrin repeat protein
MRRRLLLALLIGLAVVSPAGASFYDLLNAARANDTALARELIAAGTEPNGGPSGYPDSYAPLMWAARHGNIELMRLLLAAGADTERRDFNGDRAMVWAASAGQAGSIALLIAAGSPVDAPDDPYQMSPLMLAARSGHPHAVRILIIARADLDARDHSGGTALYEAVLTQNPESVRLLLNAGADPDIADEILRETPLHLAAERQDGSIVRMLLAAGATPIGWDGDGSDPLHLAAFRGLPDNVAALLEGGADPRALDDYGLTPLMSAIEGKRHEVWDNDGAAALLVPFSTDVEAPFIAAAAAGLPQTAMLLLARGANPNTPGVLAFAAALEQPDLVDAMIAAGADLGTYGPDALVSAASSGRIAIAIRLLERGVPIDASGAHAISPVRAAAEAGQIPMLRFLLGRGALPVPPGDIRLAELTPIELFALEHGKRSAALDTTGLAIRERLADLRARQLLAHRMLIAAFVAR